MSLKVQLT